jgi:tetratricopeptide (TPR) repeat protein
MNMTSQQGNTVMVNLCPICGSTPMAGARFCRSCGSPLNTAPLHDSSGKVISPLAQTIPLTGEGRATDGISADDTGYSSLDTARVKQDEMERLFRQNPERDGNGDLIGSVGSVIPTLPAAAVSSADDPRGAPTVVDSPVVEVKKPVAPGSRRVWQVVAVVLLFIALTAGALAIFYSRQPVTEPGGGAAPIALTDQKKLVDEQLAEAASLMSAGDIDGAIAKLRYAVKIDPANSEAHLRLGRALEAKGERSGAIDEYNAAIQNDPTNVVILRALATAQFAEARYPDAAESYSRIVGQMNQGDVDDNLRLEFADALRLAGRVDEARAIYQRVSSSESRDLAQRANQELSRLPAEILVDQVNGSSRDSRQQPITVRAVDPSVAKATIAPGNTGQTAVLPPPPPVNNRPTESNSDRFYRLGVNIVQGRDVKTLQRAALLEALQYFQNVKDGAHYDEAKRYEERLGKEYDRRRTQK